MLTSVVREHPNSTLGHRMHSCYAALLLLFAPLASAIEGDPPIIAPPAEDYDTIVDTVHESIEETVASTANRLDAFFGSSRTDQESTGTRLHLSLSTETDRQLNTTIAPKANVLLRLPRTEDRLRLMIQSGYRSQDEELSPLQKSILAEETANWFATALQYVIYRSETWNIHSKGGIAWRDIVPDPFASLYARYLYSFDSTIARLSQEVFWYGVNGPESESRVEFDRDVSDKFLLRLTSTANWQRIHDAVALGQSATLLHKPKTRYALAYTVGVAGHRDTQWHLEKYFGEVRFRTEFWRNWLFVEFKPAFEFPTATRYAFTPKVSLVLEAVFGKQ